MTNPTDTSALASAIATVRAAGFAVVPRRATPELLWGAGALQANEDPKRSVPAILYAAMVAAGEVK